MSIYQSIFVKSTSGNNIISKITKLSYLPTLILRSMLPEIHIFFCLALSSFSFRCRCHKCNIQFETRAELRRHKRKEHPEPSSPVECPVCHKKYNNNYMRDHLKSHNSDAFKCDICEKLFSSRSNLSKHKRKHNPGLCSPSQRT